MYTISEEAVNAFKQASRNFSKTYIDISGIKVKVDDIETFTINSSIGSSDTLNIGNANVNSINVAMFVTENTPAEFKGAIKPVCVITDENNNDIEVKLGTYYIDNKTVKNDGFRVTFTAYDMMNNFDRMDWNYDNVNDTDSVLNKLIENEINVQKGNIKNMPINKEIKGMNVRDLIKDIALLQGANAMFNANNELVFVNSYTNSVEINADNYITFKKTSNTPTNITGLSATVTKLETIDVVNEEGEIEQEEIEKTYVYKSGDSTGIVLDVTSENIQSQEQLDNVYKNANYPFEYQAFECECQGMPFVESGDRLNITTVKNESYNLFITSHELVFDGGFKSTFRTSALEENAKKRKGINETLEEIKNNVSSFRQDITTATGDAANALIAAEGANTTANDSLIAAIEAQQKVDDLTQRADNGDFKGEDAVVLMIDSSRGTVFKNDKMATKLSVTIYNGANVITDYECLKKVFGPSAMLQWKWQRADENTFGTISASDSRFLDNGFGFMLSPDDVDEKITFMCELIID